MMRSIMMSCLALLAAWALPGEAVAGRFAAALAVETWPDETVPLHGIAVLAYDFDPWLAEGLPAIVLDTDTLRLSLSEMRLGDRWRFGVDAAGEYGIAGLLTDYYVDGEAIAERGFAASYVEARARLKRLFDGGGWGELTLGGRRWFFERRETTSDALVLPPEVWVVMPRLHLGIWRLADDAGWRDRHRLFPRLRGFAIGIELGLDLRSDDAPWGNIGPRAQRDARNPGATLIPRVAQWMRVGVPLGERVRVEVEESAGYGVDEDDLSRARIGGMNPYVVTVPGAPWAAWLAGQYVGARMALPIRLVGDVELAPTASIVALRDRPRTNSDDFDLVMGAGATLDARFGDWQVDLRGGVSPSLAEDALGWSAYLGVGWGR